MHSPFPYRLQVSLILVSLIAMIISATHGMFFAKTSLQYGADILIVLFSALVIAFADEFPELIIMKFRRTRAANKGGHEAHTK